MEGEGAAVGWIAAIILGGIAGWLAEKFMDSHMGLITNIILGMVGAAVAGGLFGLLGITFRRLVRLSDRRIHRRLHPDLDRKTDETTSRH